MKFSSLPTFVQYGGTFNTNNVLSLGVRLSSSLTEWLFKNIIWWASEFWSNFTRIVLKPEIVVFVVILKTGQYPLMTL